jgi:glycerate kinase
MKIVIAFDSFKGCLSSQEIVDICEIAIAEIDSSIQISSFIIADGGEGTIEAVVKGTCGRTITDEFTNLENIKCKSIIGVVNDICILESAQTVGLTYSTKTNVSLKTSRGLGEQIKFGISRGFRKFAVGLGGSGTNDCGIGMLMELGFRFFDKDNHELPMDVKAFVKLAKIDDSNVDEKIKLCEFTILSDVSSPLFGKNGATYVYGSQKGATVDELPVLDAAIQQISSVAVTHYDKDCSSLAGSGAAGGLGYAFLQFLNARAVPGIEYILEMIKAEDSIQSCDYVFTGEGKSDAQTACGKVAAGVAKIAGKYNKPVLLISGALDDDAYSLHEHGIDYMTSIQDYPSSLEYVMHKDVAAKLLSNRVKEIVRLIQVINSRK